VSTSDPAEEQHDPTPRGATALIAAGAAALRAGDLDTALARFLAARDAAREGADLEAESAALRQQSFVWRQRADWERALECAEASVALAEDAGVRDALAESLNALGTIFQAQGDFDRAEPILRQAAEIAFDHRVQALAYANMGSIAAERGDLETARRHFLASAERFRQAGYHFGEAVTLNNFGRAALDLGNARIALPMLQTARGAARRAGDAELLGIVQTNVADAHQRLGEHGDGTREAAEALEIFTRLANHLRRAECLRVLGALDASRGDAAAARARYAEALEAADVAGAAVERQRIEEAVRALPDHA
jgi:tetratricopeptide (TPR) repeat protein